MEQLKEELLKQRQLLKQLEKSAPESVETKEKFNLVKKLRLEYEKAQRKIYEERYDSILVHRSFKAIIKDFSLMTGITMIDLIETSMKEFMKNYKD